MLTIIKISLQSEFTKYLVVSALALGIDLGIFSYTLRYWGISWALAASMGFVCGVILAYLLSIYFVFSARRIQKRPWAEFTIFVSIGIAGLLITQICLWIGIEWLKINPELSKLGAATVTFASNFLMRKIILFRLA